jgi:hypothetical protein
MTMKKQKEKFNERYQSSTDSELLKEILFFQSQILDKGERTRQNTNTLVWCFFGIPALIIGAIIVLSLLGLGLS